MKFLIRATSNSELSIFPGPTKNHLYNRLSTFGVLFSPVTEKLAYMFSARAIMSYCIRELTRIKANNSSVRLSTPHVTPRDRMCLERSRCNCDAGDNEARSDGGLLTVTNHLPVKEFQFSVGDGSVVNSSTFGLLKVGPLFCAPEPIGNQSVNDLLTLRMCRTPAKCRLLINRRQFRRQVQVFDLAMHGTTHAVRNSSRPDCVHAWFWRPNLSTNCTVCFSGRDSTQYISLS